ncbi:MAG: tRNA (adenosine(37)-N6)-threonylcarbamoyltransferase complex ATPase subunit type 1 TsaE [Dehalococcoidia bacterium]|nr:tRNA (adenosine(37)-N6)-threonylcarbamoyltransferase complex ATPase subunit type 1 TsaE [Dehalococcoidia bacterium]
MSERLSSVVTRGPSATRELGERIGEELGPGSVIALIGELGCGKTCFTKGICAGLAIPKKQVNSPTFAFVNEYHGRLLVLHLDLYRIEDASTGLDVGIMDYLARARNGVAVVEWAEKVLPLLPDERLVVRFEFLSARKRRIELAASGARFVRILRHLESR